MAVAHILCTRRATKRRGDPAGAIVQGPHRIFPCFKGGPGGLEWAKHRMAGEKKLGGGGERNCVQVYKISLGGHVYTCRTYPDECTKKKHR